jgi:hypothetical protein
VPGTVGGGVGVGCGGRVGRRESHQGVVDLAQQGGHAGLLGQDAGEKVGERWSFLIGPLRGQNLDQMGELAREDLKLALEGLAVFKKDLLGVIHLVEQLAGPDDVVGDTAEVRVIGVVADPQTGASGRRGKRAQRSPTAASSVWLEGIAAMAGKPVCAPLKPRFKRIWSTEA